MASSGLAALLLTALPAAAQIDFVTEWGSFGTGNSQFDNPNELAVDDAGFVYVLDRGNGQVKKFQSDGTFVTKWGGATFNGPNAISVDPTSGNVYVGEDGSGAGANRIFKYDSSGTLLDTWTGFDPVKSLSAGNVNVWAVVGSGVQQLDGSGAVVKTVTATGLTNPKGVAVDVGHNRVYVGAAGRIFLFHTGSGSHLLDWDAGNQVAALAVSPGGEVYAAFPSQNAVRKYTSDGAFITEWTGSVAGGAFSTPRGVAATQGDTVFVSDSGNDRVQSFTVPSNTVVDVSLPDKESLYDANVFLPVAVTNTNALDIVAAEVWIEYDSDLVEWVDVDTVNTIVAGTDWTVQANTVNGAGSTRTLRIAMANATALTGAGNLIRTRFHTKDVRVPATAAMSLSYVLFNTGDPTSAATDGSVTFVGNKGTVSSLQDTIIPRDGIDITVDEPDADYDGLAGTDEVTVVVTNLVNGDTRAKTLTETSPGVFQATQLTVFGQASSAGTLRIEAARGDSIELAFVDSLTANGNQSTRRAIVHVTGGANGNARITQATQPGDTLYVRVEDADLNTVFSAAESATALVVSSAGDSELVVLTEVDVSDKAFFGSLKSNGGAAIPWDGKVSTAEPEILTVIYDDVVTYLGDRVDRTDNDKVVDPFGDADGNASVQAFDAAQVLLHSLTPFITGHDSIRANVDQDPRVSGISPFDASLILQKRVQLISKFPVQLASSALHPSDVPASPKRAVESRWLALEAGDGYLSLTADARDGIVSGDVVLQGVTGAVTAAPELADFLVAARQTDDGLHVVFAGAQAVTGAGELLRITGTADAAQIAEATLNDGAFAALAGGATASQVLPTATALVGNHPNPFNPETQIRFDLAAATRVELRVYDVLGQTVRTLVSQNLPAGSHTVVWDGRDAAGQQVSSGTYIYRLVAGDVTQMQQMMLLK